MANTHPITKNSDGTIEWKNMEGDKYIVTGILVNGNRFPARTFNSWRHASMINLYRGTKWLERDGKRYVIQKVGY